MRNLFTVKKYLLFYYFIAKFTVDVFVETSSNEKFRVFMSNACIIWLSECATIANLRAIYKFTVHELMLRLPTLAAAVPLKMDHSLLIHDKSKFK